MIPFHSYSFNNSSALNSTFNQQNINLTDNFNSSYRVSNTVNMEKNINDGKDSKEESTQKENRSNSDSPMFEFLGIRLYSDDILIICLLFFLLQEDVHDEWLFLALILLLLS